LLFLLFGKLEYASWLTGTNHVAIPNPCNARTKKPCNPGPAVYPKFIREGIAHRQINSTVHPQKLSHLIIATLEGALLISLLQENRQPPHDACTHRNECIERNVCSKAGRN
jgi:hypothetical protein